MLHVARHYIHVNIKRLSSTVTPLLYLVKQIEKVMKTRIIEDC